MRSVPTTREAHREPYPEFGPALEDAMESAGASRWAEVEEAERRTQGRHEGPEGRSGCRSPGGAGQAAAGGSGGSEVHCRVQAGASGGTQHTLHPLEVRPVRVVPLSRLLSVSVSFRGGVASRGSKLARLGE